ncbi:ArsR/SmtB family transcription factor [Paenibacillus sp. HGF5]|uniref:ArsR/SmtB family transcription factor n=1 Tax=Paenibacillus sp. HGF5 TaxID=908341 RepID=UPI0002071A16|nr:metalloregulator ArsR/SmtB family transcription factor [Paenibacillus sp. HGF5]EGG35728.1 transcriptional regulator, ArsR family [Paenibacillus sp. HGF5]
MKQTTLHALAEPNRLQMVELLREGPLTVNQIAERLQIRQPQTSKHLKILHEAGLVKVQAEANRRIYKLRPEPLQEMDEWLDSFRSIWEKRLDQLEDYLEKIQKKR